MCVYKGHTSRQALPSCTFAHNNLMCGVKHALQGTLHPGTLGSHAEWDWGPPPDLSDLQLSPLQKDPEMTAKDG